MQGFQSELPKGDSIKTTIENINASQASSEKQCFIKKISDLLTHLENEISSQPIKPKAINEFVKKTKTQYKIINLINKILITSYLLQR